MYGCDEQIGYVSVRDQCTYSAPNVRLCASEMSLEQYRPHCALYVDKSPMYVKYSWMYRASLLLLALPPIVHDDDDAHGAYELYAVSEEPNLLNPAYGRARPSGALHVSQTAGLTFQSVLDRVTELAVRASR